MGVRHLLKQRLDEERDAGVEREMRRKIERVRKLASAPVAIEQGKVNEQHYELPTDMFLLTLGARRKYSSCYYESPHDTLDTAENSMLRLYCERASLVDGMSVFDLGCGWGSLTLYVLEHFPACKVTSLSNSHSQRRFIESEAERIGAAERLRVITGDVQAEQIWTSVTECDDAPFDRIFCIEMFEHMKNYAVLLQRISSVMEDDARLFVHYFCHSKYIYEFETEGATNWMGRHFFTGGTMLSDDALSYFQDHVKVVDRWRVNGCHYAQTSEHWILNFDRNIAKIRPILRSTYGDEAVKWEAYWRTFYLAVAELFGYNGGNEWHVALYLFEKRSPSEVKK